MAGKVKVPAQGENKAQYYERWLYRCRSRKGQCKTYEEQTTRYFFFFDLKMTQRYFSQTLRHLRIP